MYTSCCGAAPTMQHQLLSDAQLKQIAKDYHAGKLKRGSLHPLLWRKLNDHFKTAIESSWGKWDENDVDLKELNEQLKLNAAVFSAFKNHQQAKDLHALLVDEDGKKRSFSKFLDEAKKVDALYNQNWLETEFNYATRAARAAKQWNEFQSTKRLYPSLKYMPSRAGTPRQDHKQFYGLVYPIDHPFWDEMLPPNGWGCLCSVQQTEEPASDVEVETVEQIPGIPGNPGKAKMLFTASHTYVANTTRDEKKQVKKELEQLLKKEKDA